MSLKPKNNPPYYEVENAVEQPYKVYQALITQSGTNPPTANVLRNTIDQSLTWEYDSEGVYMLTSEKTVFPTVKTWVTTGQTGATDIISLWINENQVEVLTPGTNGALTDTPIEIRTYVINP